MFLVVSTVVEWIKRSDNNLVMDYLLTCAFSSTLRQGRRWRRPAPRPWSCDLPVEPSVDAFAYCTLSYDDDIVLIKTPK